MTEVSLDHDIDRHIGQRLRARRRLLGLSQPQVAEAVGVRFQQIQKYECGEDCISAYRLWRLCGALDAPVDYFFEGLGPLRHTTWNDHEGLDELRARREAFDLARSFEQLGEQPRQALLNLARSLGDGSPSD